MYARYQLFLEELSRERGIAPLALVISREMMKEPESIPGNSRGEKDLGLMVVVAVNGPFLVPPQQYAGDMRGGPDIPFGGTSSISLPALAF